MTLNFLGRGIDYEGARDEESIIKWTRRATGPAVTLTKNKLSDLIIKHQNTPIFLYNGNENSQLFETFQTVAEKFVPTIAFYKNKVNFLVATFWKYWGQIYVNFGIKFLEIMG